MNISFGFIANSVLLGAGLAMDAFSVSLVNGLAEPKMKTGKMNFVSGTFGLFQTLMPLAGWVCVHTVISYFSAFQKFIPWFALILLGYIGGKMLIEGIRNIHSDEPSETPAVGFAGLMVQAFATSIDALSVGFTISDYGFVRALISALIIGVITYVISFAGIAVGKRFGTKFSGKAAILGGVILIVIGIEVFIKGLL